MSVRLQTGDFDPASEAAALTRGREDIGAVVTFTGIVRNREDGGLLALELEHYPGMTERALEAINREARARWRLEGSLILHRHGRLVPGDRIMMVATAAAHRQDAFEAAEFLMDYLKSRAPFWKKEHTRNGASWVEAQERDETALDRWVAGGGGNA